MKATFAFILISVLSACSTKPDKHLTKEEQGQVSLSYPKEFECFSIKTPRIFVKYTEPVDGYTLKGMWLPEETNYGGNIDNGNTILYIENGEKHYMVHTENKPFDIDLHGRIKYSDLKDGETVYIDKKPPIHFFDVDFDGEKELIISYDGGWYGRPFYEVYKTDSDYPKLMDEYPFTELDCETKFDAINKTITNTYVSGHDREIHIYKQREYEYRAMYSYPYSEKRIMELDSIDIMELKLPLYIHKTYKRNGYKMKLIKRELVIFDKDIDINDYSAKDFGGGVFTDTIVVEQEDII